MSPQEVLGLLRYVAALCPAQRLDEYAAEAWADVVGGLRLADAQAAAVRVAARQPWIAPSDVVAEVRRLRVERLDAAPQQLPDVDPDDVAGYLAGLREQRRTIADGAVCPRAGLESAGPSTDTRKAIPASVRGVRPPDGASGA